MRPLLALTSLVTLTTAACGEPPPPPPPPARVEAPPPPEPPRPPAPLAPPTGRALLVATEYGLSPIACFFDQAREFAAGEACLALAPTGAELWLMSAQTAAKVTGRGQTSCPDAPPEATLQIELERELLRGDALLPPTLKSTLTYAAPTRPDEVDRAAPKDLRARLDRALHANFPELGPVKLRVDQRAELDLDGDGALEQLLAVTAPAPKSDDDAEMLVSALFLSGKDGPPVLLRGRTSTRERYTVLGALDLDGDGRRELYLNTYDDDGFSLSLEQQTEAGLETRGRWTCGA